LYSGEDSLWTNRHLELEPRQLRFDLGTGSTDWRNHIAEVLGNR
jgi:hypothetical protein